MNIFPINNSGNKKAGSLFSLMMFSFIVFNLIVSLFLGILGVSGNLLSALLTLSILLASLFVALISSKDKKEVFALINKKFNPLFIAISVALSFAMIFGLGFTNTIADDFFKGIGITIPVTDFSVNSVKDYIFYSVFLALIPAMAEELFFRGILITNLKTTNLKKILISALCFSLYHCSLTKLVYQFIYGLILGLLFVKTNNLILPIITHFLNNFIILTVNFIGFTIDLFNPIFIASGIFVLAVCVFFLVKNLKLKNKENAENVKNFFVPYSLVGFIICLIMIIGGIV